jgi:hypothetical protein
VVDQHPTAPNQPPAQPARRRGGCLAALLPLLIVAAIFGGTLAVFTWIGRDKFKDSGQPVVASAGPTPTPSWLKPSVATSDGSVVPKIRYELESRVLESAGVSKPTSSTCDSTSGIGHYRCTVVYDKAEVPFVIDASPKGTILVEYKATTAAMPVTREGLLAQVAARYSGPEWTSVRCDEFPEYQLAPVDKELAQTCYVRNRSWDKTQQVRILPSDTGAPLLI